MRLLTEWGQPAAQGQAHTWELSADDQARAHGSWHDGSPDLAGAAVFEGVHAPDGVYRVDRPLLFTDRRLTGEPWINARLGSTFVPNPDSATWAWGGAYMASGNGGRGYLQGVSLDGLQVALRGLVANQISWSTIAAVRVRRCTEFGIRLTRCQSTRMVNDLEVTASGGGILVSECNRLQGSAWNVADCSGDGLVIVGGYPPAGSWSPFASGCSVQGVTVERCLGNGITVRDCLAPVHLGGCIWIEACGGAGLLVDNATVVLDAGYITGPTRHLAVQLRNRGRLFVRGLTLGGTLARMDVDRTSQIRGRVDTYRGNRLDLPGWPRGKVRR